MNYSIYFWQHVSNDAGFIVAIFMITEIQNKTDHKLSIKNQDKNNNELLWVFIKFLCYGDKNKFQLCLELFHVIPCYSFRSCFVFVFLWWLFPFVTRYGRYDWSKIFLSTLDFQHDSTHKAMPIPPPIHSEAHPFFAPFRCMAYNKVTRIRQPINQSIT